MSCIIFTDVSHVEDDDQFKHDEAGSGHGHEIGFAHSDDRNQELGNLNDLDLAHYNPNDLNLGILLSPAPCW